MSTDNKIIIKRVIFSILTLFCICFIFSRSLMPGEKSGEESSKILNLLNDISEFFGVGDVFTHNFVRKCAHFIEFTILGVVSFKTYKVYALKTANFILFSVFTNLFVAITDELIQFFVPGRACQFADVLIDVSGGTFGILICQVILMLLKGNLKRKSEI